MTPLSSKGRHSPLGGQSSQQPESIKNNPLKQRAKTSSSVKHSRIINVSKRIRRNILDEDIVTSALQDRYLRSRGPGLREVFRRVIAKQQEPSSTKRITKIGHHNSTKPNKATKRKMQRVNSLAQRNLIKLQNAMKRSIMRLSTPVLKLLQKRIGMSTYSSSAGKRSIPRIKVKGSQLTLWEMIYSNWQAKSARAYIDKATKQKNYISSMQSSLSDAIKSMSISHKEPEHETEEQVEQSFVIEDKGSVIPNIEQLQVKATELIVPAKRIVRAFNQTNHSGQTIRQIASLLSAHLVETRALTFRNASMLQSLIVANDKEILTSKYGSTIMKNAMSPTMQAHMNRLSETEMVNASAEFGRISSEMIDIAKACLQNLGYISRRELHEFLSYALTKAMKGNSAAGDVLASTIMIAI